MADEEAQCPSFVGSSLVELLGQCQRANYPLSNIRFLLRDISATEPGIVVRQIQESSEFAGQATKLTLLVSARPWIDFVQEYCEAELSAVQQDSLVLAQLHDIATRQSIAKTGLQKYSSDLQRQRLGPADQPIRSLEDLRLKLESEFCLRSPIQFELTYLSSRGDHSNVVSAPILDTFSLGAANLADESAQLELKIRAEFRDDVDLRALELRLQAELATSLGAPVRVRISPYRDNSEQRSHS